MDHNVILIQQRKKIALVAHDNKKPDLLEWAQWNRTLLANHELYATGTTGKLLEQTLSVPVHKLQSGPLGGDQQVGAMIADGTIDFMIFFWDPLSPAPHDPDVKALLRIAVVWNIPVACNRASADFMISSTCMVGEYERLVPDFDMYRQRSVPGVPAAEEAAPQEAAPQEVAPEDGVSQAAASEDIASQEAASEELASQPAPDATEAA